MLLLCNYLPIFSSFKALSRPQCKCSEGALCIPSPWAKQTNPLWIEFGILNHFLMICLFFFFLFFAILDVQIRINNIFIYIMKNNEHDDFYVHTGFFLYLTFVCFSFKQRESKIHLHILLKTNHNIEYIIYKYICCISNSALNIYTFYN